jgi:hypothetical protein
MHLNDKPLSPDLLRKMNAYWRTAASVAQDAPLRSSLSHLYGRSVQPRLRPVVRH